MEQVRKMGSISKLLGMLPGMGEVRDQINSIDDREIDRVAAIIKSMTPHEREDPKIINGSRRARIARGSGTQVTEVNNLVERFFEARKMMKQMAGGGMPGLPGMPGMPGPGRRKAAKGKKGGKGRVKGSRSGNPAKRAAEIQAQLARQAGTAEAPEAPANFELPEEFKNLLPPDQR